MSAVDGYERKGQPSPIRHTDTNLAQLLILILPPLDIVRILFIKTQVPTSEPVGAFEVDGLHCLKASQRAVNERLSRAWPKLPNRALLIYYVLAAIEVILLIFRRS